LNPNAGGGQKLALNLGLLLDIGSLARKTRELETLQETVVP